MMTRREAILMSAGLGAAAVSAAATKDFWNEKQPAEWTDEEIQQMLTRSPWAKSASIFDSAAHKGAATSPRSTSIQSRRGGRPTVTGNPLPPATGSTSWAATVRWDSALPVREALKTVKSPDAAENYLIALVGDIPGVGVPSDDDDPAERKQKLEMLQEFTRIERRDDPLTLQNARLLPRTPRTPAGTLFVFSRAIAIKPEDKQVTFVTKVGPLEVKCRFVLRDMLYRGILEL